MRADVLQAALFILLASRCWSKGRAASEVHAFFYLWYGTPEVDGQFRHWDHEVLPHWTEHVNRQFPQVGKRFNPSDNLLHSPFYPLAGPYSSRDTAVVRRQIEDMARAGISVAVLSWWGQVDKPYATDTQGVNTDSVLGEVLRIFDKTTSVKVAFHLEPYPGRSASSVREDLVYLIGKYGHHKCLYRSTAGKPLVYVYDSYHIAPAQWAQLLRDEGEQTIRGDVSADAVVLGLWLHHEHGRDIRDAGFDGFYTYFATDGFSFGSTTTNWGGMCQFAQKFNLLCNLSVGPGYNDSLIRPWNDHNSRSRQGSTYYNTMWTKALKATPHYVSVTSFNEWGEGTQIEPAVSMTALGGRRQYLDYGGSPYLFLDVTQRWAHQLTAGREAAVRDL
jgi:glycoprotein endo-alpha-1,2-mannosidase